MPRVKKVPTKSNNSQEEWKCQNNDSVDYIPFSKRRKGKGKPANLGLTYKITPVSDNNRQYHLGELCFGQTNNVLQIEPTSSAKATFIKNSSSEDERKRLLLEFDGDESSVVVEITFDYEIVKVIISSRIFALAFHIVDGSLFANLYFSELPLVKFTSKLGSCIQFLFCLFYNTSITDDDEGSCASSPSLSNITEFYKGIKQFRSEGNVIVIPKSESVQHCRLKPVLRPYQEDAVRWMLWREKRTIKDEQILHPLYIAITLKSGLEIYYDKSSGYVDPVKPIIAKSCKGGILADEMGLGKTVEVLACILNHPKPDSPSVAMATPLMMSEYDTPTVDKISRKRHAMPESKHSDKSKKIKLKADFVPSGKKSQLRLALESWYDSCLNDVRIKPSSSQSSVDCHVVQCICGSDSSRGSVACCTCGKLQHGKCMGYKAEFGKFLCPQCWTKEPPIESSATLIVTPVSLRSQWCNEICKHVSGGFRVLQFGGSNVTPIYPTELAKYDVVVTTYSILQSELRLTEEDAVRSFRNERRYSPPKCPLTMVKWWRLCLDEAQTVETTTTMVSTMAKKLSAEFRWAVTGTPISKEISDLYGLIEYLQMEPYNEESTWKHVLFDPFLRGDCGPIYDFLSQVLWRSSKNEILDQINIPKQTEIEHSLSFSAVEQFFYGCEHRVMSANFLRKARHLESDLPLQSMAKSGLSSVLAPFSSLRQVCTYPNSAKTRYLGTRKTVISKDDLLEALIARNTGKSEEHLRLSLSALNGLAGIYLLLQTPSMAVENYREVLQLYARFTEEEKIAKINVDKLPIIHTMHNLNEILQTMPVAEIPPTLRDHTLVKDRQQIEQAYISKFITKSLAAYNDFVVHFNNIDKMMDGFKLKQGQWYSDFFDWLLINHEYYNDLCGKVVSAHENTGVKLKLDLNRERVVRYTISTWDEEIAYLRENALDSVNCLYLSNSEGLVNIVIAESVVQKATDCHLRPQKKGKGSSSRSKCKVCVADEVLKKYELRLFTMVQRKADEEHELSLKGSWKPSTEELIFKSMYNLSKQLKQDPDLIHDGEVHVNLIEAIKKEFKELRRLWTFLDQQIKAQDEMDICKTLLQLKPQGEGEEKKDNKKLSSILKNLNYTLTDRLDAINLLSEHELEFQRTTLYSEKVNNLALLERNLGTRKYLETLKKQQSEPEQPQESCPICKNNFEKFWSILPCGHSYCVECIQSLIDRGQVKVQCSVCRSYHSVTEISYLRHGKNDPDGLPDDDISIEGSYSTKIEAVIKLILKLKAEESDVKILVFSSWPSVLTHLRVGLDKNLVITELITNSQMGTHVEKFKDPLKHVTALLLPINLGSKGLNLVEATHVILIEPLLNPGDELQAVGRVHRIGQTRPTFVHKFYINSTIEESIKRATNSCSDDWDKNRVTLKHLMELFVDDLGGEQDVVETDDN